MARAARFFSHLAAHPAICRPRNPRCSARAAQYSKQLSFGTALRSAASTVAALNIVATTSGSIFSTVVLLDIRATTDTRLRSQPRHTLHYEIRNVNGASIDAASRYTWMEKDTADNNPAIIIRQRRLVSELIAMTMPSGIAQMYAHSDKDANKRLYTK